MTRKYALLKAIEILQKDLNNKEICDKLNELLVEYPNCTWTKDSILDVFEQYIQDNNALPMTRELGGNKFPSHSLIKSKFGLGVNDFYKKYFKKIYEKSTYKFYHNKDYDYWISYFISTYKSNNCSSMKDYDMVRNRFHPSGKTIIKMSNCKTWTELLSKYSLDKKSQKQYNIKCICKTHNNLPKEIQDFLEMVDGDKDNKN